MMRRWIFLSMIAVLVACAASASFAAESKFEISMVDKFQKLQTAPVIASRASVENLLYNSIFNIKPVWDSFTREERLAFVEKTQSTFASGLGIKIRIKKAEKLKNIEFQLLPLDIRGTQILIIATNLLPTKTGLETVSIEKGMSTLYKLDGEHLALCSYFEPPQEELDQLDRLIQKDPKNLDLRLAKAQCFDTFDQRVAIKEYEKIIEDFPDAAVAYNNLAMIYTGYTNLNLVDPDKAVSFATKACELTHNLEVGHLDTLARAYFVKGEYQKALDLAKENVKKTDDIDVLIFLEILETHPPQ